MKSFWRRGGAAVTLALAITLAFSATAFAGSPAATDLPTVSSSYNAAWQPAPTGYTAPSNDGLGVTSGQIKHVWVIVMENHAYDSSFTPLEGTQNSYLEQLPSQGALLTNYYGTGHSSLDNYLSMTSGQAPLADTQDDCPSYNAMSGSLDTSGTPATNSDFGQFVSAAGADAPPNDNGCVYPSSVKTIFNQLSDAGDSWKVYAQDVAATPAAGQNAGTADCGAPESTVGSAPSSGNAAPYELNDGSANATSQYVSKHNPLAWFESELPAAMGGTGGSACANNLASVFGGTSDSLYNDLQSTSSTPDLSYIVPDNCSNGHDAVCHGNNLSGYTSGDTTATNPVPAATNYTGGTYAESQFLSIVIPEIEASPAFKAGGMIVVNYDESYPPFTYSNDSQADSQLQNADASGSLANDSAGETLYGRSLSWEPTGPNATVVTSPSGQVLTAGPGDSAYLDRPTTADQNLVACTEPTLDSGNDSWVNFTAPTSTNGKCIPGFQAGSFTGTTTLGASIADGSSTVDINSGSATPAIQGDPVTFTGTAPTLTDNSTPYTGTVYVGSVTNTPQTAGTSSSAAFSGTLTFVDGNGNPLVDADAGGYSGSFTTKRADTESDPFFDAYDATLGGGDSGAVVISPYITPGTVSNTDYNHYSLLRTLEDIFGNTSGGTNDLTDGIDPNGTTSAAVSDGPYLGFAAQPGLAPFGSDVFTNDAAPPTTITNTTTVTNTQTNTVTNTTTDTVTNTTTTPGKTYAVVPYVIGDSEAKAESAIRASGLKVGKITKESGKHKGSPTVVSVSPGAGKKVLSGSTVELKVS